eukprot:gene58313-biopygen71800
MVRATVGVSERIALLLSRYSVDEAEAVVGGEDGQRMPAGMREAYQLLLHNLCTYRPYLPHSVLNREAVHHDGRSMSSGSYVSADRVCSLSRTCSSSWTGSRGSACPKQTTSASSSIDSDESVPAELSPSATEERASDARGSFGSIEVRKSGRAGPRDVDAATDDPLEEAPSIAAAAQRKTVSLYVLNRLGWLPAVAAASDQSVVQWFMQSVPLVVDFVCAQKGVMDLLSGDHFSSTFAAVRPCGAHRLAAVRCASCHVQHTARSTRAGGADGLDALNASSAACSGAGLCGDYGSASVQRFMVVGGISSLVLAVERVAAERELPLLVDAAVWADAETNYDARLREQVK